MTNDRDCLFQNYVRAPVAFTHGRGARLYDAAGREYLDFIGGIATSCLGHAHPRLVGAIADQARRYLHVSNLFRIPEQERAARLLVEASRAPSSAPKSSLAEGMVDTIPGARGLDRVFFCNSGTEANEAAIKIARKRGYPSGRHEIIVTHQSFHGRTLGSLAATGNPRYHQGFGPLPQGFVFVDWNDLGAARAAVGERTCAVLVEPVLGESGVLPAAPEYLRGLEALCRERDLLFLLDEVQTGIGRTGSMFAFHHYGVEPDVVTLAKALGGGVAVGAVMAKEETALLLVPGDHGSTFGGNALATAAVAAVLETIRDEGLLDNARAMGERLRGGLAAVEGVTEVRGLGLLVAAELRTEAGPVAARALENGLLVNAVRPTSIRMAPPLVVTAAEIDRAVEIFARTLQSSAAMAGAVRREGHA
ncbi:MAG TPA: aspartate aminotransferase family protein [Thermoanaerobaculia bacterium]|nr:aspartate aminotransferase family protein [Thermoanaerobaculia bacterium]